MLTFIATCGCVFYDSKPPEIHNCPLHAAAPTLLAALQAAIRALEGQPSPAECRNDRWIDETLIAARAAIRAAKGEPS